MSDVTTRRERNRRREFWRTFFRRRRLETVFYPYSKDNGEQLRAFKMWLAWMMQGREWFVGK